MSNTTLTLEALEALAVELQDAERAQRAKQLRIATWTARSRITVWRRMRSRPSDWLEPLRF